MDNIEKEIKKLKSKGYRICYNCAEYKKDVELSWKYGNGEPMCKECRKGYY